MATNDNNKNKLIDNDDYVEVLSIEKDTNQLPKKDLKVENLSFDDVDFGGSIDIKNGSNGVKLDNDFSPSLNNEGSSANIIQNNTKDMGSGQDSSNITSNNSSIKPVNDKSGQDNHNNSNNIQTQDNRGLKQRAKDAKDGIKDKANKIKNAPNNARKKIEDTKKKVQDTKDKIKNAPENLRKKKDQVKNAWNNRPRNLKDVKDKVKNANINDKIKKGATKAAKKAEDKAIDAAKNSSIGQKAQSLKRKYDIAKKIGKGVKKATQKISQIIARFFITHPYMVIPFLVFVVVLSLAIIIMVAVSPGAGGDVNDNENFSKFSEVDQKTLEKIRKLFNKYPNADASLAMVTVLYPYFENLHDGNVVSVLSTGNSDSKEDKEPEIPDIKEDDDDQEELEDSEEDIVMDDPYLLIFRNYTIRTKLKRLLKEQSNGNESYNNYLKNTYFKNDKGYGNFEKDEIGGYNGYKEMFDSIDSSYHDDLANEIIIDLYNKKDWFIDYVFERMVCSSSSTSLGHSDAGELIKGDAVVVLKDTSSTDYDSIKAAEALYGTDDLSLRLKRYVLGVAYSEIGANVKNEAAAKAEMITAQSFLLGRTHPGSGVGVGMNFTPDYNDTQTIFYIRGNTYDQDFCDVYEGCETGSKYAKELIKNDPTGEAHKNTKGKLDDESIKLLEKWYDEIATKFIYDDTNKMFYGVQFSDYNDICKVGACLAQKNAISLSESGSDYNDILFGNKGAFTESRFVLYDSLEGGLSKVSTDCVEMTGEGSCTVPNDKFIYYSQKVGEYSGKTFCGREDATIKSSGCGITAMAMVVANLSNSEVTPDVTNAEAQEGGYCGAGIGGTSAGYFKAAADKYGLKYSSGSKTDGMDMTKATNDINNTLRSGGLVIINVNGNWLNGNSGHYIVAKGIDASDRLIIADPYADRIDNPKRNLLTASEIIKNYVNVNYGWYMFTSDKSMEILNNYCTTIKVNSDGTTTGYLTDPITPTNTNAQTRASLKGNSQSLYYLSGKYHGGTDFPVPIGTPVRAMDGGVVVSNGFSPFGFGRHVVIEHTINNTSYWSVYAHLNSASVSTNDKVSQGQVIGLSGNTGYSSGPHLHVGLTTKRNRLGNSGKGYQYLVLKYIGTNVSYVGQPTD